MRVESLEDLRPGVPASSEAFLAFLAVDFFTTGFSADFEGVVDLDLDGVVALDFEGVVALLFAGVVDLLAALEADLGAGSIVRKIEE